MLAITWKVRPGYFEEGDGAQRPTFRALGVAGLCVYLYTGEEVFLPVSTRTLVSSTEAGDLSSSWKSLA